MDPANLGVRLGHLCCSRTKTLRYRRYLTPCYIGSTFLLLLVFVWQLPDNSNSFCRPFTSPRRPRPIFFIPVFNLFIQCFILRSWEDSEPRLLGTKICCSPETKYLYLYIQTNIHLNLYTHRFTSSAFFPLIWSRDCRVTSEHTGTYH